MLGFENVLHKLYRASTLYGFMFIIVLFLIFSFKIENFTGLKVEDFVFFPFFFFKKILKTYFFYQTNS